MFPKPLCDAVFVKVMFTREDHDDFIRLVLTLTH